MSPPDHTPDGKLVILAVKYISSRVVRIERLVRIIRESVVGGGPIGIVEAVCDLGERIFPFPTGDTRGSWDIAWPGEGDLHEPEGRLCRSDRGVVPSEGGIRGRSSDIYVGGCIEIAVQAESRARSGG